VEFTNLKPVIQVRKNNSLHINQVVAEGG
jgi:hypothetical protein